MEQVVHLGCRTYQCRVVVLHTYIHIHRPNRLKLTSNRGDVAARLICPHGDGSDGHYYYYQIYDVSDRVRQLGARPITLCTSSHMVWCNSQHNVVPDKSLVADITHVALAFMSPATFNRVVEPSSSPWPLFTTVETARSKFTDGTAVMVAIGGWGDTASFGIAAATDTSRKLFAHNVKVMIGATGADGRADTKALSVRNGHTNIFRQALT